MFTEAIDLSVTQNLYAIMGEYGWPTEEVDAVLEDDGLDYAVKQEMGYFQNLGISGVPFFILNNKYGFSGAQPVEVFVESINKVAQEMQPPEAQGGAYAIDGSNC